MCGLVVIDDQADRRAAVGDGHARTRGRRLRLGGVDDGAGPFTRAVAGDARLGECVGPGRDGQVRRRAPATDRGRAVDGRELEVLRHGIPAVVVRHGLVEGQRRRLVIVGDGAGDVLVQGEGHGVVGDGDRGSRDVEAHPRGGGVSGGSA